MASLFTCVLGVAQANVFEWPEALANDVTSIVLAEPDVRYDLTSLSYSSGFIPAPKGLTLESALDTLPIESSFGLQPNFNQHNRYWLYARVFNETQRSDWVLHISNFGFQQPRVLVQSEAGKVVKTYRNSGYAGSTDINTLGRAVTVNLEAGQSYWVVVELSSSHATWYPYLALMSGEHYHRWTSQMDMVYQPAIGIIAGLIFLGFLCWLITRETSFFWASLSALLMLAFYLEHSSLPALLWQSNYEKTALFWLLVHVTLLAHLAFSASFLGINRKSGNWFYLFFGAFVVTVLSGLLSTAFSFETKIVLYALSYLVVSLVILGSGFAKVRTEGSYYIIYLLGWFPMVLSIFQVAAVIQGYQKAVQDIGVSYKMIHVLYIQILHMFLHAVALILRIRALREQKLRAEYLSHSKSLFIAQSSHDLSQPLNSMRIFLDHLSPYVHDAKGRTVFQKLATTHQQMSESFKAIMDLSKLEAGVVKPEFKPVKVSDLFTRLQHEYGILAADKGIRLTVQPSTLIVFSDPVLLERMLRNLISNAVKFTDAGGVIVGCRRRGKTISIQVLDTGRGIEQQAQDRIFDMYHRLTVGTQQPEGSGIGLSIVRHVSDLLDHPVKVTSVSGKGTRFEVCVPRLGELWTSQPQSTPLQTAWPVVAMVFEDDTLATKASELLTRWHCLVETFSSVDAYSQSRVPCTLLLCDRASLLRSALSAQAIQGLAQHSVLACICPSGSALPEPWIAVQATVLPAQLRSVLNVASRRHHSLPAVLAES
ncbi:sensor histidine kinase [Saccharospirillum impatiens]|uniref:sensor histidine kinase n=1 Tax=Saccharospirillum impatiens TaxID=169438 RepID=UPI000400D300|nr:sensor histidine kinase [Saccharospirillum impatiens]